MTLIMDENAFGSIPNACSVKSENSVSSKIDGTIINNDELIITQPNHAKTSHTTKNGRYISRVVDSVEKIQKREQYSDKDKSIMNLSLYWYVRSLVLSKNAFDSTESQKKLFELYDILNKFDTEQDDYVSKLSYLQRILQDYNNDKFNILGIDKENFMHHNFHSPDCIGLTTFAKNVYLDHDSFKLNNPGEKDEPEKLLKDYPVLTEDQQKTIVSEIPKILHIVYYKGKVDLTYLYYHLAGYTANRDYKIMVWMYKFPDGKKPISNSHVEFKEFDELDVVKSWDTDSKWSWQDKFKLKYYILQQFGGIYTNYSTVGVKKLDDELLSSSFMSVFTTVYNDQKYVCPYGIFMGFPANHPYIDYVVDNFTDGEQKCGREYIYLRSALIKSQDRNVRLLQQNINHYDDNSSYIVYEKSRGKRQMGLF